MLAAGEDPQHPAGSRGAGAQAEDILVGLEGLVHILALLGESGRVHDDAVPPHGLQLAHELEGIALHSDMGGWVQAVGSPVALRLVQGRRADVQGGHLCGAAQARVDAEAARVAEGVEHAAALGVGAHLEPMHPLVEEEARLLAPQEVHRELRGSLVDGDRPRQAPLQEAVHRIEPLLLAAGLAALHEGREAFPFPDLEEDRPPGVAQGLQTGGAHLEHQRLGIAVHHQPRQAITLAEHPAAAALGAPQAQFLAQAQGGFEPRPEEGLVQRGVLEAEDPCGQRARGTGRAHAQHLAGIIGEAHEVGLGRSRQGPREDPRVALGDEPLFAWLEAEQRVGPAGRVHGFRLA